MKRETNDDSEEDSLFNSEAYVYTALAWNENEESWETHDSLQVSAFL